MIFSTLFALFFASIDPNAAIGQAKQFMNQKQYEAAIRTLQDALPDAASLADPQRSQALSALHFYTAMAYSAEENELRSREELETFFRLTPQIKSIDPKKFDPRFVRAFTEVYNAMHNEGSGTFESVYPGFALFHEREPKVLKIEEWGDSPDLVLLGTPEDKRNWRAITDNDGRKAFVEAFWTKRDHDGFRKEFLRRVAFADETFTGSRQRGSLTDRGRVFVLIGPPTVIRQKPLTARESSTQIGGTVAGDQTTVVKRPGETWDQLSQQSYKALAISEKNMEQIAPTPIAKGTVERWIYSRDQFPKGIPDAEVVFKFITQEGYGDHVLQRDLLTNKVMVDAGLSLK